MLQDSKAFSGFSVNDLAKAKEFYSQVLGLEVTQENEGSQALLRIHLGSGAHVLAYTKENHQPATFTILNFPVRDIDPVADQLIEKGITFERYDGMDMDEKGIFRGAEKHQGPNIAWFTDPAGNILAIIEDPKIPEA